MVMCGWPLYRLEGRMSLIWTSISFFLRIHGSVGGYIQPKNKMKMLINRDIWGVYSELIQVAQNGPVGKPPPQLLARHVTRDSRGKVRSIGSVAIVLPRFVLLRVVLRFSFTDGLGTRVTDIFFIDTRSSLITVSAMISSSNIKPRRRHKQRYDHVFVLHRTTLLSLLGHVIYIYPAPETWTSIVESRFDFPGNKMTPNSNSFKCGPLDSSQDVPRVLHNPAERSTSNSASSRRPKGQLSIFFQVSDSVTLHSHFNVQWYIHMRRSSKPALPSFACNTWWIGQNFRRRFHFKWNRWNVSSKLECQMSSNVANNSVQLSNWFVIENRRIRPWASFPDNQIPLPTIGLTINEQIGRHCRVISTRKCDVDAQLVTKWRKLGRRGQTKLQHLKILNERNNGVQLKGRTYTAFTT